MGLSYANDRVVALETCDELPLLDLNGEILGLHVPRDRERDVELVNLLRPLVRQGGLLLGLLCAGSSLLSGCRFCPLLAHGVISILRGSSSAYLCQP